MIVEMIMIGWHIICEYYDCEGDQSIVVFITF